MPEIGDLTPATPLDGTEVFPLDQTGGTTKATVAQVSVYVAGQVQPAINTAKAQATADAVAQAVPLAVAEAQDIAALSSAGALVGNELVGIEQAGDYKKATLSSISTYVESNLSIPTFTLGDTLRDVRNYGALGQGVDRQTLQAAIDSSDPGIICLPGGVVLNLTASVLMKRGVHLRGAGSGGYVKDYSPHNQTNIPQARKSTLRCQPGQAAVTLLQFPVEAHHCVVEDLEIDGNRLNVTGAATGIYFNSAVEVQEAQCSFRRIFLHDTTGHGIDVATNRLNVRMFDSVVFQTTQCGITVSAFDFQATGLLVGVCGNSNDPAIALLSDVARLIDIEVFNNNAGGGILHAGNHHEMIDVNCNRHGLYGSRVESSKVGIIYTSSYWHDNSKATHNSRSHVELTANCKAMIVGSRFGTEHDSAAPNNRAKYAIEVVAGAEVDLFPSNIEAGSRITADFGGGGTVRRPAIRKTTPVSVAAPSTPSITYTQAEAQSAVTAINALRTELIAAGILA